MRPPSKTDHGSILSAPQQLLAPLAVLGVGIGLATPAAQSASIAAAPAECAGMAAGVSSTMRYLGGIAGVAVLSLMLEVSGPRASVVSEHRELMVVFAGALVVGLICAILLPGRTAASPPLRLPPWRHREARLLPPPGSQQSR
jgi:MFS family permease